MNPNKPSNLLRIDGYLKIKDGNILKADRIFRWIKKIDREFVPRKALISIINERIKTEENEDIVDELWAVIDCIKNY